MLRLVILLSFTPVFSVDYSSGRNNDVCVTHRELEARLDEKFNTIQSIIRDTNEKTIATMEKMIQARSVTGRAVNGEGVAFSVTLTGGDMTHIGLNQPIKYNNVQLNEGNGYNKFTGSFTAPTDGVYLFSYFLGHGGIGQMWLELMHNGNKVNAGVTDAFERIEDEQGGNVAIIHLNYGDTVWVESWHQNDATLDGDFGFTTFSGVMIY